MSVCEKCGKKFEPQLNAVVTTTRVLCKSCAAARAAEKLRAKAPSAASPAPRPAAPAPSLSSSTPAPKPVRRVVEEDDDEDEDGAAPVAQHVSAERRESRTAMLGWIVASVLVVVAGAVVFVIVKKNQGINAAIANTLAEQHRVLEAIQKKSAEGTEAAAQALILFARENEKIWQLSENAGEITTLIAKAKGLIERERQRKDTLGALAAVESGLAGLESRPPEEIAELRRKLSEIEPRAEGMGADFVARVGTARTQLDRTYGSVLHADAKSFLAANPDKGRLALQRFTRAEDEVNKLFDESIKGKNRESENFFKVHYQELITESDKLVEESFPADSLDKLPWKDLLSGEQAALWNGAEVKGFSHRLEAGTMTMVGPDVDASQQGLISIGDREQWRDFVVDLEFTLESGSFDLFVRLGKRVDASVPKINVSAGADGIVAGKTYVLTALMIGSTLSVTYYPEDLQLDPIPIHWTKARKGALGFALNDNTRLKISRLRVRELRFSGK